MTFTDEELAAIRWFIHDTAVDNGVNADPQDVFWRLSNGERLPASVISWALS